MYDAAASSRATAQRWEFAGFHLDEVVVTAARLQVPDAQSAVCPLFADGFESGGAERWSDAVP